VLVTVGRRPNKRVQRTGLRPVVPAAKRCHRRERTAFPRRIHQIAAAKLGPAAVHCFPDLGAFRRDYVKHTLECEIGELTTLDHEVIESLREHEVLSENIEKQFERKLTFGEHLSDKIAEFGGSWKFILAFGGVLAVWIIINGILLATRAFDPYPFILLNLILSCLAALQAPIIMMSQNWAEARDRLRAENDYKVNLKAELEIRHLHEKIDHLLRRQYNRLFEIQQIQIELLEEISQRKRGAPRESPQSPGNSPA
jgi:uncharacterized membrane protein